MDFKRATDAIAGCCSADEVAAALGVSTNTIRRARMDPDNRNARPAPAGWQQAVARLARQRAKELTRLAEALERLERSNLDA